jgi:hypothetical protein
MHNRLYLCAAAGIPLLIAAGPLAQRPSPLGVVRAVTVPAGPGSAEPNLSVGSNGAVHLSWIEPGADSSHVLRFATLVRDRFSAPTTIAQGAKGEWFVNWADFPSILAASQNRLFAHWLQRTGSTRYAYGVRVARSDDGGKTWSAPVTPHRDASESEHGFVSMFRQGSLVGVVWLDGRKHAAAKTEADAEMSLRYTTLNARGELGADAEIDGRVCDCCQTSAALTARGPIVAFRDRSPNEIRDIAVSRYEKGSWTASRLVHRDNWMIAACPVNGPSISAQNNSVAVAWFTGANEQSRVNVAFSRNAGDSFGAPIRVDDGNPAGRVDVHYLGDNSALVSWIERNDNRAEVRVRRVYANGRRSDAVAVATSSPERASGFPHIAVRGREVVLAWTEPGRPSQVKAAIMTLK